MTHADAPTPAPVPTGRLVRTGKGVDLVLTRTVPGPVEDVWAHATEPGRTARWIGPWEGTPGAGGTARLRMTFEEDGEDEVWSEVRIDACTPPGHLAVSTSDAAGVWNLELHLAPEGDDATALRLVQHMPLVDGVGETGPGWEYYLDMLLTSYAGRPLPSFEDYYPAQKPYFEALSAS